MTEQAKFTYSFLRKAVEKQIKTIENQGEKQVKIIDDYEKQLAESNAHYITFERKQIQNKLFSETCSEIINLNNKRIYKDLTYHFKNKEISQKFNAFDYPLGFLRK